MSVAQMSVADLCAVTACFAAFAPPHVMAPTELRHYLQAGATLSTVAARALHGPMAPVIPATCVVTIYHISRENP